MPQDLLDTAAAAKMLGITPVRVGVLIREKRLPATLLGGSYVIRRADLSLVKNRKPGRPAKKQNP